jgi:hypothetical protein
LNRHRSGIGLIGVRGRERILAEAITGGLPGGGQAHSEFGSSKLAGALVAGLGCALSVAALAGPAQDQEPDSPATIEGVQPAGDIGINRVLFVDQFVCRKMEHGRSI